jgi:hypothetical protein
VHNGISDSSVLYIPVCPTTEINARYLVRQRAAFAAGTPGPDFPGGKGESNHVDRPSLDEVKTVMGRRSLGLEKLVSLPGDRPGAVAVVESVNEILSL